jgi:hypothetical protein
VTSPLKLWNNVTITEMPFRLQLSKFLKKKRNLDNLEYFHFFRLSALNVEFGEGPYSQIIELRKIDKSIYFKKTPLILSKVILKL